MRSTNSKPQPTDKIKPRPHLFFISLGYVTIVKKRLAQLLIHTNFEREYEMQPVSFDIDIRDCDSSHTQLRITAVVHQHVISKPVFFMFPLNIELSEASVFK